MEGGSNKAHTIPMIGEMGTVGCPRPRFKGVYLELVCMLFKRQNTMDSVWDYQGDLISFLYSGIVKGRAFNNIMQLRLQVLQRADTTIPTPVNFN